MPTADLAAQRALLKLADTDRLVDAATHRRTALPEIAVIAAGAAKTAELRERIALAEVEVGDIDSAARKLDAEIDSVAARARRDEDRLASGSASPKEMEGLQREVESLGRRRTSLEDDALELMERREDADAVLKAVRDELAAVGTESTTATLGRDRQWAEIDAEIERLTLQRAVAGQDVPADALAVYERIRASGKVAAAVVAGGRCGGCGMALDKASLEELRTAASNALTRCPECGTILVRNP